MVSVYLKEMLGYLTSPIIYALALLLSLVGGLLFFTSLLDLSAVAAQCSALNQQTVLVRGLFVNMSLLMIVTCPLVSMRLIAEERATGTLELLLTYPLSAWDVTCGKYLAGLTVTALLVGLSLALCGLTELITDLDWALVLSCYLGVTLMAACFLALGILASSCTGSQIVAALLALGMILALLALGRLGQLVNPPWLAKILAELGLGGHLTSFLKGELRLKDLAYYLFIIIFCLKAARQLLGRS